MYGMGTVVSNIVITLYVDIWLLDSSGDQFIMLSMLNHHMVHLKLIEYCTSTILQ